MGKEKKRAQADKKPIRELKSHVYKFLLNDSEAKSLDDYSRKKGMSWAEVIRQMIDKEGEKLGL
jgi:hypothetical protein